ncbi:MAG TPA: PQQ-dependent sugar dehydrogenase, partial [Acidimicrobiia bacterium]|nr:PQQ-dependent sugar dehydrogenase [Acidimicrobiia bacterium]
MTLDDVTTNPMELAVTQNGRVIWIERKGKVKLWNPSTSSTALIGQIPVHSDFEDGLLGLTLDPSFETTGWLWLYYSPLPADANKQVLSRFTLAGGQLTDEVVYLEVPTDRENCCHHAAGSLAFDSAGRLYISTGDNTLHSSFAPINEDDPKNDAQRSSANTNDLRGKVLRIDPNSDGTYDIPPGNLFEPGTPEARPEIYLMGLRNPFRLSIDPATGWLYTGDVGPDAKNNNLTNGPAGRDELIQARAPANHGWPYCIANNLPYRVDGVPFDCSNLENHSINNTGLVDLPPGQPPLIWYSFSNALNVDFPEIKDPECEPPIESACGNTVMAGPVYHRPSSPSEDAFPPFYEGRVFFYEWTRDWIKTARLDASGKVVAIEPFLPSFDLRSPIEMEFGPDGVMYFLEYGTGFGSNDDASLSKIVYEASNLSPTAVVTASATAGPTPLDVDFSGEDSTDPEDGTNLDYAWDFDGDGNVDATTAAGSHTYDTPGDYFASLTVTDTQGATGTAVVQISAGNTAPEVSFGTPPDGGFFDWDRPVPFTAQAVDAEDGTTADGSIPSDRVSVESLLGHDSHAHPLTSASGTTGTFTFDRAGHTDVENVFGVLQATYTDNGTGSTGPLSDTAEAVLHPFLKQAEFNSQSSGITTQASTDDPDGGLDVSGIQHGDHIAFDRVALDGIHSVTVRVAAGGAGGDIVLREGSVDGPVVGEATVPPGTSWNDYLSVTTPVTSSGSTTLYLTFENSGAGGSELFRLNWLHFNGDGIAQPDTSPPSVSGASFSNSKLLVTFDEAVDQATAEDPGNYSISGGIAITAAELLGDLRTVELTTADIPSGTHTVTVASVKDRSTAGNEVGANNTASFTVSDTSSVLLRVNVGGPAVSATDGGPDWVVDDNTTPHPARVAGGGKISSWD